MAYPPFAWEIPWEAQSVQIIHHHWAPGYRASEHVDDVGEENEPNDREEHQHQDVHHDVLVGENQYSPGELFVHKPRTSDFSEEEVISGAAHTHTCLSSLPLIIIVSKVHQTLNWSFKCMIITPSSDFFYESNFDFLKTQQFSDMHWFMDMHTLLAISYSVLLYSVIIYRTTNKAGVAVAPWCETWPHL